MKIIVPCCGRSSRFPNQAPKYLLPGHDGRPMLALALSRLDASLDDVVVAVLKEHEEKYDVRRGFERAFGRTIDVVVHDEPTKSQAETVAKTLLAMRARGVDESFLIKDSDNCFKLANIESDTNYVAVESLNHFDSINPRNKSYVQVDHRGLITNIREKFVISDVFSVGGYFFTSPAQFLATYERLLKNTTTWNREMYISDLIGAQILDGVPWTAREVSNYEDWGTIHEWKRALGARRAYVALVDGFVFERGSEHFHPRFDEVKPNEQAVRALNELAERGHTILYVSIRGERHRALTEKQLVDAKAPRGAVLYGAPIAALTLVSAPHPTLPFTTANAIELSATDENLLEKLRGDG